MGVLVMVVGKLSTHYLIYHKYDAVQSKKRILIVTQTVDTQDPVLGFFVRWIEEFAKHAEELTVICLEKASIRFRKICT